MDAASDADDLDLSRDGFGRLRLVIGGTPHVGVVPVRSFPLAAPAEGVSLVASDGRELAWIDRLDRLSPAARSLIEEELASRDFAPVITRLLGVSTLSTPSTWRVETDRGTTDFVLKAEEDIRRLAGDALLVTSADGVAFFVRERRALDAASRRLLDRFL